jgi:hypothetical protein
LNIIDEVSFAGYHTALVGISHFLQKATECNEFHGKAAMCFLGDFVLKLDKDVIYKQVDGILRTNQLSCGTERHSSLQELSSAATDHA